MKKISLLITAIFVLVGCSKLEVYEANILGAWDESYDASKFAFDGVLRISFDSSDTFTLYTSNPDDPDYSSATYIIVKLTSNEMAWQKVGTTYSEGT